MARPKSPVIFFLRPFTILAHAPGMMLKLGVYGYLNQLALSREPERDANRNIELMCPTGTLVPDFKTI